MPWEINQDAKKTGRIEMQAGLRNNRDDPHQARRRRSRASRPRPPRSAADGSGMAVSWKPLTKLTPPATLCIAIVAVPVSVEVKSTRSKGPVCANASVFCVFVIDVVPPPELPAVVKLKLLPLLPCSLSKTHTRPEYCVLNCNPEKVNVATKTGLVTLLEEFQKARSLKISVSGSPASLVTAPAARSR